MGDSLQTIAAAVIGLNLARLSDKILVLLSSAKGLLETEDKYLAFERQNLVLSEKIAKKFGLAFKFGIF